MSNGYYNQTLKEEKLIDMLIQYICQFIEQEKYDLKKYFQEKLNEKIGHDDDDVVVTYADFDDGDHDDDDTKAANN